MRVTSDAIRVTGNTMKVTSDGIRVTGKLATPLRCHLILSTCYSTRVTGKVIRMTNHPILTTSHAT